MIVNWECTRLFHNGWTCMWWECMRVHENDWQWLRMSHIHGGACGSFHADLHYTTCTWMNWECVRLPRKAWACVWWECMRMHKNAWEWLIFMAGCVGHSRLSCIIRHAGAYMNMHALGGDCISMDNNARACIVVHASPWECRSRPEDTCIWKKNNMSV